MKLNIKAIPIQILYYCVGYCCLLFFGLFKIPLITNFFKPEQLGVYFLINSFLSYIDVLFLSWVNGTIWRHINDDRFPTYSKLISSIMPMLGVALLLSVFTTVTLSLILNLWDLATIIIAFFASLSTQIISIYGSYLLYQNKLKSWTSLVCIQNITSFVLLVALMFGQISIVNIFLSVLIPNVVIIAVYLLPRYFKVTKFSITFDKTVYRNLVSYSLLLIFSNICVTALNNGDRFLIQYYKGEASLGLYAQNYSLATLGFFSVIQAFTTLFLPSFMKAIGVKGEHSTNEKIVKLYLILFIPTLCFLIFNSDHITDILLGEEFRGHTEIFNWVLAGTFCLGFANFFETRLKFRNKIKWVSLGFFFVALINLVLNFILLKSYSTTTAAIITFGSYFILVVIFVGFDWSFFTKLVIGNLILKIVVASFSYFLVGFFVKQLFNSNILSLLSNAIICLFIYFLFLKKDLEKLNDIFQKVINTAMNRNATA